jgi:hypothetical protein
MQDKAVVYMICYHPFVAEAELTIVALAPNEDALVV